MLVLVFAISCARTSPPPKPAVPAQPSAVQTERTITAPSADKLWLATRDALLSLEEKYKKSAHEFTIYTRDATRLNFVAYQLVRNGWIRDDRVRVEVYITPTPLAAQKNSFTVRVRLVPEERKLALLTWYECNPTTAFTPQEAIATEVLDAIQQQIQK